jgi:hypothetical protein
VTSGQVGIDHLGIEPGPTCPKFGEIVNANFESSTAWKSSASGGGVAEVVDGIGAANSRAAHLTKALLCEEPSLDTYASIPLSNAKKLALTFAYRGTRGKELAVQGVQGDYAGTFMHLGHVVGTGNLERASICIPEAIKGDALRLRLTLWRAPTVGEVRCETVDERDFMVDDLAFAPDPKCDDVMTLGDRGFENTSTSKVWFDRSTAGSYSDIAAADPHSGAVALALLTAQKCSVAQHNTLASFPVSTPTAGPAIKLFVRGTLSGVAYFSAGTRLFRSSSGAEDIPVTPTWTQVTRCLTPRRSSQATEFSLLLTQDCAVDPIRPSQVFVDDVELTTDPSCPTTVP